MNYDIISRRKAIKMLCNGARIWLPWDRDAAVKTLMRVPAEPKKISAWVYDEKCLEWVCSECRSCRPSNRSKYCDRCGTEMLGGHI